ncbi:MAG: peptidase S16 [Xanthomonadales bacterium]|nr:peptidase S16 [Xanthomonadales bacterium]NIN60613.1 peptidase S16 [Xanthomonadales bacterium]NIN75965.1 peptidase S16 [Xanthomonadales bacterium]NIO15057.1 peptidase S16 [Xanthomonadales bacterium]NIP13006.1 peptidase S16 [Xanthomonadales bacterium]
MPLFPLNTVLVPGGFLPLRIFEPRYLDMVRECARNDNGFGVCLILSGGESGSPPEHVATGTLARIRDFHTLEDGLLGITAEGGELFRIESTRSRDNGLLLATVQWETPVEQAEVPTHYLLLANIVAKFMEKLSANYPSFHSQSLEDAAWVGFRLVELLPLRNLERQALLELRDPLDRLQRLVEILPRFQ